ncbi:SDR family oxidoreductase [[Limnothrix rosea] IAM M-220]|uniref:SDR family oxidoreductase n=1 Tax=[Limnothrix rosea] IAM M-220 TaxID=454133 RepID=UPI000967B68F|nr:SDR family oxidoreductase [[Limnothrix rosea] IAM M-220]OKH19419.1 short-chain dehydrogenase [[Limnothrix rosea] IAM M-220]
MISQQTALITGGAKRIGAAIARALAAEGVNLIIHYRSSADAAEALKAELAEFPVAVDLVQADLLDPDSVAAMIKTIKATTPQLDILINNASMFNKESLFSLNAENLWSNIQVHAFQPFVLTKAFFDQESKAGNVINFLDTRIYGYDHEHVPYHLSKKMLHSLTKMLAWELAPHVRVNGIAPGPVLPPVNSNDDEREAAVTAKTPLKRFGSPDNVVQTVLFYLKNDFITGQVICVDGGFHLGENFYV